MLFQWFTLCLHTMIRVNMSRDTNLLSSWPPISSFSIFPLPLLPLALLLAVGLGMAVASFFMRQALAADRSCGPVDGFMDCSCVEAFPTHSSCLLHGCYMFKTLLSSPNQYREGGWWDILLPSPLKAVLTLLSWGLVIIWQIATPGSAVIPILCHEGTKPQAGSHSW